jgi:hypothetical protein
VLTLMAADRPLFCATNVSRHERRIALLAAISGLILVG